MRRIRQRSFANVDFADFCRLIELYGFELARITGSHHIYRHPVHSKELKVEPSPNGDAMPYQVRQFLQMVERDHMTQRTSDD